MASKITAEAANAFLREAFPDAQHRSEVVLMEPGRAVVRMSAGPAHMRPGDLVSGPTQMAMADSAAYMAVFTELGITPMAVTSNLNVHFLRGCRGETVEAKARIVKLGRTQAVISVDIRAVGDDDPASLATVTYSLVRTG